MRLDDAETNSGIGFNLLLQVIGELLVALGSNHRQRVHLESP
jgi:hypothetical protein